MKFSACALALLMVIGAMSSVSFVGTAQGDGETVYIAMQQDMPNFNNFDLASNTVWKDYVIGKFAFESLSGLDPAGNIFPLLAESWDFDPFSTPYTVTVHLRQNVQFHDGEILDADDVIFSYLALRDGTTLSSSIIDAFDADDDGTAQAEEVNGTIDHDSDGVFEGITKIDQNTVKMVMAKAYGQFFLSTLGIAIIPEHIWSAHVDVEGRLDTLWGTDKAATIATGPFYYKEGQPDVYRVMSRFEDYWGKTFTTPLSGYRLYPAHVKNIHYKLYSSLDTAILALKSGYIDHLPWTITPGYVPDLTNDPNTDLSFVSDNGYFYLAFNQKRKPMNILAFRQAVSHVIDKDTIVNRYMGGYGSPGDSCEAPFWTDWYNTSVETYTFSMTEAQNALAAGGFTGIGTSLTMPDGKPVPPLVILTPPADYDPIRIKAGELIAKNLRSLGINVIAKPLDFDALVAKMNAFDYDMLIIGWSLSSDPIGNVFDILGPLASQNYFAFWSTTYDNPLYNELGGVSTLADAQTQAYADQLQAYSILAKQTFDRAEQIEYTKAGQGIVSLAIPVNVLYYRVNIYAVSTSYNPNSWINFLGELLNIYSMGELTPAGAPPVVGEEITSVLYAPDKLLVGTIANGSVMVLDSKGMPLSGASISLTGPGLTMSPMTGTTDADGMFEFNMTASGEGYISLTATASLAGNQFADSKIVQAVKGVPNILHLSAIPGEVFLRVTENTVVDLYVYDGEGNPVEEATVALDEGLLGYGTMDNAEVLTDATGHATMTYTAPADLTQALNTHLKVRLSLAANKTGYSQGNTNTVTQFITVYNPSASDWHFVSVDSVSDFAMDDGSNISTVGLLAYDATGTPLDAENINIQYTNEETLANVVTQVVTVMGVASFDVQFKNGIDTNATRITFKNELVPNCVGAAVTLLYKGVTVPPVPIYGGVITFTGTQLLDPNGAGTLDFDVEIYDIDGVPPVGDVDTTVVIGQPSLGSVALLDTADPTLYSSLWDYAGIQSSTDWDNSNVISGGYFLSALMTDAEINTLNGGLYPNWTSLEDDWWTFVDNGSMLPVTITNGVGAFTVGVDGLVLGDSVPHILIVPNGLMGFYVTPDFANFYWVLYGNTTMSSEFATMRAMSIISATMDIDTPVMRSLGAGNSTYVDVTVLDQDNLPVTGASVDVYVSVYGAAPFFEASAAPDTDATGSTSATVWAQVQDSTGLKLSNPVRQPLYANPSLTGYATIFASNEIFNIPIQLFIEMDLETRLEYTDNTTTVTVTVTDEYGTLMSGLDVTFGADNGTVTPDTDTTDAGGEATTSFEFGVPNGFQIAIVSASTLKEGYVAAAAALKVEGYNEPSTIDITPVPATVDEDSVTIGGDVADPEGIDTVQLILDGGTPVDTTVTAGSFEHTFTGLADGSHAVTVVVTDDEGDVTETEITFIVDTTGPAEEEGLDMIWIIIAIVVIIVVIAAIAGVAMKRKGAPPTEEEIEAEEEAPVEEAPVEEEEPAEELGTEPEAEEPLEE